MAVVREDLTAEAIIRERGLTKPEDRQRAVELAALLKTSDLNFATGSGGGESIRHIMDRLWDVDTAYRQGLGHPPDAAGLKNYYGSGKDIGQMVTDFKTSPEFIQQETSKIIGGGGTVPYQPAALPGQPPPAQNYTPQAFTGSYTPAARPG